MYLYKLVFSLFPYICPGVGLLDHTVVLLIFWETPILFSILAAPIYIATNSIRGFPFHHMLTNTRYCDLTDDTLLMDVRWHLILVLTCTSLMISNVEHCFIYLFAICLSFLGKYLFRSSLPFSLGFFGYFLMLSCCKLRLPLLQCSQSTCSPLV